jgi:hypothetical protein
MGWLGWVPEVALATDVNLVVMALDSRSDLITTIFGDGKKRPRGRKKKVSAGDFKAFAERHNRTKGSADG